MRTEKIEVTYYQFDELNDDAKEKARDWYRRASIGDDFWSECVIDDAKRIGALFGLQIKDVFYSGFWSQGDGAKVTGRYEHKSGALKAVRKELPIDTELHAIVSSLVDVQKKNRFQLVATIESSGRYQNSMNTSIGVFRMDDCDESGEDAAKLMDTLREYMDWIYRRLEKEYDYQNSDETIDENIRCNEYEFDVQGNRI